MTSRESHDVQQIPDRLLMTIEGISEDLAEDMAKEAVSYAMTLAPKMSGLSSRHLTPVWGPDVFGITWPRNFEYIWYQENGISPFTMLSLAGKTIPMWVNDPLGKEREANPNAETRQTMDGRTQVLIFRKAAPFGSRKTITTREGTQVSVPRSYPGAPGRIHRRELARPWTARGRVGGRVARGNVGVRWRHPGLPSKSFLRRGLLWTCERRGIDPGPIRDQYGRFR